MIVKVLTPNKRVTLESDCADLKEAFEFIGHTHEVFNHDKCGACGSADIRPVVRTHDSYKFYSLQCDGCRARLEFGQRREDGGLFPKRKDAEGKWLDNGGWTVYQRQGNDGF